ncbi:copper chaperone PCu(A)C [Oceanicella sp. SM1341]|uniref:copper chaperone PCu(A)C n=1 Tax=Oceanicella sp. SM1341 TaxID=1548889 RepID=UPI000E51A54F|nr:copper chaperone PCu(A)C [Oceanicella sp. SM1341]
MKNILLAGALAALAALPLAGPAAAQDIRVEGAYAVVANPMSGAAYMVIRNEGSTPDRLTGAESPVAKRTELHGHEMSDGIARMRAIDEGLPLPPGGSAVLERGGLHLMFMGLAAPLQDGETIPVTLQFESGARIALELRVTPQHAGEIPPPAPQNP